jgi:glycosyltransferase involved in cell wall biosynthesis
MVPSIDEYAERLRALTALGHRQICTIDGKSLASMDNAPVLSVVTVAWNSGQSIERTIASVMAQSYRSIEYIVIDGGSTDGTLDILRRWQSRISYWHSVRDAGISDAFNLGIAASHGRYVALVNADDWMSPDQAARAIDALERSGAGFVFGRLAHHRLDGSVAYTMDGQSDCWRDGLWRMPHVNHPTVVARRSAYESVGLFDVERRIAMDYDWHLRAELQGVRGVYVAQILGHMTEGGICNRNWQGGLREVRDIAVMRTGSRVFPNLTYAARLARGRARLALRRVLPQRLVDMIHRKINPRYAPTDLSGN